MEDDTDEEEMEDVHLVDERERHWRMVFEENDVGVDNESRCYILRVGMLM